ncbi:GIY-YIG nuclease family protein [Mongoliimonas terrestris]|uniref:GIY-YIG nuclease family protein n=1 Tax=Mongoliimonas terrestris TaxID=1709001 RepID=UPI000949AF25|nr:GIY-YIG nuclease family protein [Mongoliimonas terrestris]
MPLTTGAPLKEPAVYILASGRRGTLYTGVTSNLPNRVWEHKHKVRLGFTAKYRIDRLVWFEMHETMETAIRREKQIKDWRRLWKVELVEASNPDWRDLSDTLA